MTEAMIEARDLSKRYGDTIALDNVSFQVKRGEVLGFLGPNGAGKTTTMKILTCFIAPSSGTAFVNGANIFDDSVAVRSAIGYLPENTPLYVEMLVAEYLEFVAAMRGLSREATKQAIERVVEQTNLGQVLGSPIGTLSKGYRQRVGLAQAMIHEPAVLILDEPMSGLDPNQAVEIRNLIREIGKERTVILSTHNLAEVQVTCSRVLIVSKGKIVADDTPEQLSARTGKPRFVVTLREGPDVLATLQQTFSSSARFGEVDLKILDQGNGEVRFELVSASGADLREAIFRSAIENQLTLLGLEHRRENLEDIFRQLTTTSVQGAS